MATNLSSLIPKYVQGGACVFSLRGAPDDLWDILTGAVTERREKISSDFRDAVQMIVREYSASVGDPRSLSSRSVSRPGFDDENVIWACADICCLRDEKRQEFQPGQTGFADKLCRRRVEMLAELKQFFVANRSAFTAVEVWWHVSGGNDFAIYMR